ncbi:MAG TPA: glycosyltransferase family 2 protein [Flavisolibacter sp.]|jgi:glycosyltransferase involved in cell wall biosynthesis|nr:glycosyltransferase family 2 protein [Flavisolibacter sp.]
MQIQFRADNQTSGVLPLPGIQTLISKRAISLAGDDNAVTKVSAVIIAYNEERIIRQTLSRLWWCDEIIIIDSFSSDQTVKICEEFGCSIFQRAFNGFGDQKNFGISKAKNNWILCLDADEVLSEPLIEEIRQELTNKPSCSSYKIPLNLVFMNRVFRFGKESNATATRLFDKTKGSWDGAIVHECLNVTGPTKTLKSKIYHYSYQDYDQFLHKINLYSSLGAQKLLKKGKKKSKAVIILAIPFNFFKYYLLERNFLNGFHGLSWAAFNTFYHFLKYAKLEALRNSEKQA